MPASVKVWGREVCTENQPLRGTVEILQEVVSRNSQNSSQPPSQDRPEQKPAVEPPPPPHQRGGQPGHRGHHRALVDEVDEIVVYKPVSWARGGTWRLGDDPQPYRHQVTELPLVKPQVTAYPAHRLVCPCCGQNNRGELPPAVAASWFRPNVISLVGRLMGRFRLSKRQVTDLLEECFAIPMAASRSGQVARELLGETYGRVAGTDRCSADTGPMRRPYCGSPLLRDFQKILERGGDSYPLGWDLKIQAEYLLMKWTRVRDGTLAYHHFLAQFPPIQAQIRHGLTTGLTVSSSRTVATCRHLLEGDAALWLFVTVPGLEPTKNSAERALCHPVIWRRTSHGTQSDPGSRFVERTLTVVETCRQQQRPVFDFLREALIAYRPRRSTRPLPLPHSPTLRSPAVCLLNAYPCLLLHIVPG
jgi:hypothetical protein